LRLPAPDRLVGPDHSLGVSHRGYVVLAQEGRSIQIDDLAELTQHERWRHGETRAHHVADHHSESQAVRLPCHRQSFGEAATLVELDIDDVESSDESRHVREPESALIRHERNGRYEPREVRFTAARERLLELRDVLLDECVYQSAERRLAVPLVGIDPEPHLRPRRAYRAHTGDIE